MSIHFYRIAFLLGLLTAGITTRAQTITIDNANFAAGDYGPGSDIAIPIRLNGCFNRNNRFDLSLSDASGNFPGTVIGQFTGFFTPFVNGRIPAATPQGTQYRIRITSTSPAVSVTSAPITIVAGAGTANDLVGPDILASVPEKVFGKCDMTENPFEIVLQSNGAANNFSHRLVDSLGNTVSTTTNGNQVTFNVLLGNYYTFFATLMSGGTKSVKAYLVLASASNLNLGSQGTGSQLCLPQSKTYTVESTYKLNYPGCIYTVEWGDGSPIDSLTQCELSVNNGEIKHFYTTSSCGQPPIPGTPPIYNAFRVTIKASNKYCSNFEPFTGYPKVFQKPVAAFTNPQYICLNTRVTFINTSTTGLSAPGNAVTCNDAGVRYKWYVNGSLIINAPRNLDTIFNTVGNYTIRLVVENNPCVSEITHIVCVEPRPVVEYFLNGADSIALCTGDTVFTDNQSSANNCRENKWKWRVCYYSTGLDVNPNSGIYTIVPNDSAYEPYFIFHQPGIYIVHLGVTNSCGTFVKDVKKIVNITGSATVTFPPDTGYCTKDVTIDFGTNPLHKPNYNANQGNQSYTWTVTGGGHNFTGGTGPNDRYPIIRFQDYGLYTITLVYVNNCGTKTVVHRIRFSEKVTADAGPDTLSFCASPDNLNLTATVTGPAGTLLWTSSGTGSFTPGNAAATVYTLSAADKAAGSFKLRFSATPTTPSACAAATDSILVLLSGNNTGRDSSLSICSNTRITYTPVSSTPGSSFQWTSQVTTGTATGNTSPGSGTISDALVNTGITDAIITYTIIPSSGTCAGDTFRLTVTVKPRAAITATVVKDSICSGSTAAIQLTSNITPTLFSWTAAQVSGTASGFSNGSNQAVTAINPLLVNTTTGSAVVEYRIWGSTNGCSSDTLIRRITVLPGVAAARAGNDTTLCNAIEFTLQGTSPAVGSGTWREIPAATVTITNPAQANSTITGLVAGQTYSFEWTVTGTAGVCTPTRDTVTINNLPPLSGNSINPPTQAICINNTAAITGSLPTGGSGSFTYVWLSSTDNITYTPLTPAPLLPNQQITVSPTTSTWYKRVIRSGACSDTSTAVQVTVNGSISNNTLPANREICTGTTAGIISGSPPQGGGGGYTYSWEQSSNGQAPWTIISGAIGADYDPGVLTQSACYRRNVTTATCGSNQPQPSNVLCITVRPDARAIFTARDTLLCAGAVLDTTITVTPFSGNGLYSWYADGVPLGTPNTTGAFPGYTMALAGDTVDIRLDVQSAFGCRPDSKTIRLITTRNVVPAFTKSVSVGCGPLSVSFTNTSSVLDGTVSFTWLFGNGQTSISTQPGTILFNPNPLPRDTTYHIILRADNGCSIVEYRDSIRVLSKPRAGFTPTATRGCSTFTPSITNGSSLNSSLFYWNYGYGSSFVTANRDTILKPVYITNTIDTFKLRLIAENVCGRDTAVTDIIVSPRTIEAAITVSGTSQETCAPGVVNFLNASIGAAFIIWNYGDGSPLDTTLNLPGNFYHTYVNAGTYFPKIRFVNDCTDTMVTRQVVVYATPKAQFTLNAVKICTGDSIRTTNTSLNANAYEWIWGDGGTNTTATNATHTFTQAGFFTVQLVAKKLGNTGLLCMDTAAIVVEVVARIPAQIILTNTAPLCAPGYTLSVTAPGTTAAGSIQWTFFDPALPGGQFTASGSTAAYQYQQPGSYSVKLVVTNSAGCRDSVTRVFTLFPKPKTILQPDTIQTCNTDTTIRLIARSDYTGPGTLAYSWRINGVIVGTGNPYFHRFTVPPGSSQPVVFTIEAIASAVTNCGDTSASASFTVLPSPRPKITVSPGFVIRQPERQFTFSDSTAANINKTWLWTMGDGVSRSGRQVTHPYGNTGSFLVRLLLTDFETGCRGRDSVRVTIEKVDGTLFVPNAFYPNSQKYELRSFLPKGKGLLRYQLQVFDGLGKLLFETTALDADGRPSEGWDGKYKGQDMPQDAYLWVIRVADFRNGTQWDGMQYNGDLKPRSSGTVTLFR